MIYYAYVTGQQIFGFHGEKKKTQHENIFIQFEFILALSNSIIVLRDFLLIVSKFCFKVRKK